METEEDTHKYTQKNTTICTICLDEITDDNVSYLPCCHGFHQDCFNDYISEKIKAKKNISCPICRIEHFTYGQRNYQFIMNELGINYESDNNRIQSYQQYIPQGFHSNREHNIEPIPYIPHAVLTMPVSMPNNLTRIPSRRRQQTSCDIIWFKYRYYIIGLVFIAIIGYVSFLIISTFR